MATSAIEAALVEASGFEPTKNYERQDYLAALARAVNEIEEDDFDALTVEAQDWFNLAVKALNKKQELPDFPDLEEDEGEGEAEDEADDEGDPAEADDEGDPTDDNLEDDSTEDEAEEPPKAAKPKKVKLVPPAQREAEAAKVSKKKPASVKKLAKPGTIGGTDKYGLKNDSQGHRAILMLEAGARMSAITEEVGGTYYNLLKKLVKEGHKIEKSPNGIIKLTHKDSSGAPKKVKGKK